MTSENNLHQKEISLPLEKVYRIALILLPVISISYLGPFLIVWFQPFYDYLTAFVKALFSRGGFMVLKPYLVRGIISIVVGIVLHELLHGLGWIPFTKRQKTKSASMATTVPRHSGRPANGRCPCPRYPILPPAFCWNRPPGDWAGIHFRNP